MEMIKLSLIGLVLGMMTVVPGVSIGTLMVVFNVYDRLIEIITPNVKKILAAWKFWLPLISAIIIGIFLFSKVIVTLFENYELQTYWFIIGIILGSIPLIYNRVKKTDSALPSLTSVICCVITLGIMIVMAIFRPSEGTAVYTSLTVQVFLMLFIGGVLSAIAMIIPGISGTFLILAVGLYRTVIQAVNDLNIHLMIPFILGTAAGLLAGAALVRFLLARAPKSTYAAVLGLIAGSVIVLFPGNLGEGAGIVFSVLCILAGSALSFFMGKREAKSDG